MTPQQDGADHDHADGVLRLGHGRESDHGDGRLAPPADQQQQAAQQQQRPDGVNLPPESGVVPGDRSEKKQRRRRDPGPVSMPLGCGSMEQEGDGKIGRDGWELDERTDDISGRGPGELREAASDRPDNP